MKRTPKVRWYSQARAAVGCFRITAAEAGASIVTPHNPLFRWHARCEGGIEKNKRAALKWIRDNYPEEFEVQARFEKRRKELRRVR